jgi:hypothetical protein
MNAALLAQSAVPTRPLPARETLRYSIEWRLITAGRAVFDWNAVERPNPGWHVTVNVQSVGLVSKLFKVGDTYHSNLNQTLCAESTQMISREGSRQRETNVQFNYETHKAGYIERDQTKDKVILSREIDIPPCVHDVAGGLYYLRTLDLEPGQSTEVPVSDGKKSVVAKVEAQQREEVKVPAGTFSTVRYEIYLFNNVLYRRSAHLYVWFTDDHRRLPVQIRVRMQLAIGTITLQLEKDES